MKNLLVALILPFAITSCKKTDSRLEGSWIYAYNIDSIGRENTIPNSLSIIEFDRDQMKEQIISNPSYDGIIKKTYPLKITSEKLFIGEVTSLTFDDVSGDSLVLKNENSNKDISYIYKRLPNPNPKPKANPAFKLYTFKGNDYAVVFADFINDSTLIEYDSELNLYNVNEWYIQNINKHSFLINGYKTDP